MQPDPRPARPQIIHARYPVFILDIARPQTACRDVADIVAHFRRLIERHPCARFLGVFDHMSHTRALPDGEIAEGILDAQNVVFCFGMSIPNPEILALRPRSIGIAELADRFVVSFLETPMPLANSAMETWAQSLLADPHPGSS
jgi:hypothetical protein